jgi:hypothetical protein
LDGPIIRNEKFHKSHKNPNSITRLGDISFLVDPPLPRGCAKFFKFEHSNEFKEGDKLVRLEFSGATIVHLNWKLCRGSERLLSWVYVGVNKISFSNKIEGNRVLAIEIEKEQRMNSTEV